MRCSRCCARPPAKATMWCSCPTAASTARRTASWDCCRGTDRARRPRHGNGRAGNGRESARGPRIRAMPETLPLFPLHAVLVPGGGLELRVFEPRYLGVVREWSGTGRGFGVCLFAQGREAGALAMPVDCGTEAVIEDFGSGPDGLLQLRLRGQRRFGVLSTRVRDNGLVEAQVAWRAPDPADRLRPEHALLGEVLRRILEQVGDGGTRAPEERFDEAAWVGWRLAELLPLQPRQRQRLLEEDDPARRLDELLRLLS